MDLVRLSQTPEDRGQNRVLVVDDDLKQRMLMVRILRGEGYECATAMSTEEARNLLDTEDFGVVVTDLKMWGEDGLELVRYVADHHPETSSVVVTGASENDLVARCRRAGAVAMMAKPLVRGDFADLIATTFDLRVETLALRRHQRA